MKKNDLIELEIYDMGVGGEGIGKCDGMTFFVKDAVIGDKICARITKLKKNYGYARIENIVTGSEHRVVPPCTIHARCGGCQIQAMSYDMQLAYKEKKVRENLVRLGGFESGFIDEVLEPIVGMEVPFRYRNKAQFPIGRDKNGNIIAGFYAARTHFIIETDDCLLGVEQNAKILRTVISYMNENGIEPYDEVTGQGIIRHVLIRYGFTSKELMTCLVINAGSLPAQEKLIDSLKKIDGMTSISVNINDKNTNVIMGDVTQCIWGQPYITDYIHMRKCSDNFAVTDESVAYQISPQSFYQVNPIQTEKLYSLALEYAELTGNESVWDLYCGIGTISLFLAKHARKVYGVEIIPQAIEDAKHNAELNGITNAEFFVGKVEEVLPQYYENEMRRGTESASDKDGRADFGMLHPDVIVVDPPRKGCDMACLDTMIKMKPDRIVYISCDPATLARDLKVLCGGGYALKAVRPVDCFCNTTHVENVACLRLTHCSA